MSEKFLAMYFFSAGQKIMTSMLRQYITPLRKGTSRILFKFCALLGFTRCRLMFCQSRAVFDHCCRTCKHGISGLCSRTLENQKVKKVRLQRTFCMNKSRIIKETPFFLSEAKSLLALEGDLKFLSNLSDSTFKLVAIYNKVIPGVQISCP